MSFKQILNQAEFIVTALLLGTLLSGCQTISSRNTPESLAAADPHATHGKPAVSNQLSSKQNLLPQQTLSKDLLYDLLLAELASQRGNYKLAYDNYYAAAEKTKDPRLAKKATRVSLFAKNDDQTFQSVKLWSDIEPDNIDVQQIFASSLIKKRQDDEAIVYLHKLYLYYNY